MAIAVPKAPWLYSTSGNIVPDIVELPIDATQGILMPGAAVTIDDAGLVKAYANTGQIIAGFLVGTRDKSITWPLAAALGQAERVYVQLIKSTDKYCIYCQTGDTATAATEAMVGNTYNVGVDAEAASLGWLSVDTNANNTPLVKVIGVMWKLEPYKNLSTDSPGILVCNFLSSAVYPGSGEVATA